MTVILLFKFSSARPSNCSVKLVKMLSENFSANWVKLAAVLGSLNQHSFLSVTDSENRTCRDFKESGHSGITCKINVMKTPIRWETSGFLLYCTHSEFLSFCKDKGGENKSSKNTNLHVMDSTFEPTNAFYCLPVVRR